MLVSWLAVAFAGLADARALWTPTGSNPPLATSFPTPSEDPFYVIPNNISSYAAGGVIRARTVFSTEFGALVNAREIFYRTTNRQGNATGTVTTVFIPAAPLSPPAILSYQAAEDALNIMCAPSWANVNTTSEQEAYLGAFLTPIATFALAQGYYVVNSDDEDADSEWLVGITEGRATLDGIRAAQNSLDIASERPAVALLGYSGGAHETVWAASLAMAYAPELNIVGAAYGGTPVDLGAAYTLLNGASGAALAGGAIVGLANGYPALNATLNTLLTPLGKQTFAKFRGVDACIVETGAAFANVNFSSPAYFNGGDPMKNPVVAKVVADESLLMNVSSLPIPVPKFPRYEWHGLNDSTVPYEPEKIYVEQQCQHGANIAFVSYPGLNHDEAAILGLPGALRFIEEALKGAWQTPPCGQNLSTPVLGSVQAIELLGAAVDALLLDELTA
ncbi:secretory lipase-domain-containing protein [Neohortaea acidophila]|uniref:Secretory lipase-domain-containing protein n=1 Tax=Neohortaea acidophila TaxID=245834 RepID=A0A6A6Q743_9PEZI|nr:secretory lipase-domain-containing protein [Neohortaea acidophila]KAF2488112.1 secretory lipase-domain-containing protein [Neohortaea acidophila]